MHAAWHAPLVPQLTIDEQFIALGSQVLMTISAIHGLGNHEHLLSHDNIVQTNFWSWMGQVVAIMALAVGRLAVIAFLLSVQARTNTGGRWVLYIIGFMQAAINIAEVILILHQCTPIEKLWNPDVQGTCKLIVLCSQLGFLQGSKCSTVGDDEATWLT